MTHNEVFSGVPVGASVARRWDLAPTGTLDSAAQKVATHGANPWVFTGDARAFWQFAREAELAAFAAFSAEEHLALLGPWDDAEYYPETFGYSAP